MCIYGDIDNHRDIDDIEIWTMWTYRNIEQDEPSDLVDLPLQQSRESLDLGLSKTMV